MKSNQDQLIVQTGTQQRVVVVTAAGSGIGKAIARRFLSEGVRVVAIDIDTTALQRLAHECSTDALYTHSADVTDAEAVEHAFGVVAELGELHALVNAAGSTCSGGLLDLPIDDWQHKFDLNLTSVFLCCRAAVPLFERSTDDRVIINLSSSLAHVADPGTFAYSTFKAGLEQMTRSMALELAPLGIRVVAVAPGPVASTGGEAAWEQDQYVRLNPLGRFASVDEIAGVIAFLASAAGRYVTGTTLRIDGGDTALGIGWGSFERLRPQK